MQIHGPLPIRILPLCALLLLIQASCGSRRQGRVRPPTAPNSVDSPDTSSQASQEPGPIVEAPPSQLSAKPSSVPAKVEIDQRWPAKLLELRQLFAGAVEALEAGRLVEAAELGRNLESGIGKAEYPLGLNKEFQELADEIAILNRVIEDEIDYLDREEGARVEAEEEHEPSPRDEIGDLNLYQISIPPELENQVSEDLRNSRFDIPIVLNELVLKSLEYFQGRGRGVMEKGLQRAGRYIGLFREIFTQEGIPNDIIYMAQVESLFSPRAYSRARARGVWQFVSGTARLYGLNMDWWVDERSHVEKSTVAAARHLRDLYQEFQNWELVLAAYNAGPGRIRRIFRRYGEMDFWTMVERRLLPRETRNHIPSVLAAVIIFKNPQHYDFDVKPDPPLEFETVRLDYQIDLRVIAEQLEVVEAEISELNPYLRRGITPQIEGGFELRVPLGTANFLEEELAKIPPDKRLRVRHHKVQRGDTLWDIARKYGTSVRAISEVNRLPNANRLRLGQDLIIPLSDWRAMVARSADSAPAPLSANGKYSVRRGDSLYVIARRYGITITQLARWNNMQPSDTIYPGQQLLVAAKH